jgi:catechol 2,3-dioxygenase-like lactoylglutathione lyase family enzyme
METPICQIALSVVDRTQSSAWYKQLGLEPSGGLAVSGEGAAKMLELPELDVQIGWLRGCDAMSQLELIEFSRPTPRPLPKDWGPRYAGYGIVGLVVSNFDGVLRQLRAAGRELAVTGPANSRSIWTRDPDGIAVEIMEKDPLGLPRIHDSELASIRSITLTVSDLKKAKRYWTAGVGLGECPPLQRVFNDFPQNLDGTVGGWEQELLKGGPFVLRLLKPRDPKMIIRAERRLSDAGVLNIAAIVHDPKVCAAVVERVRKMGYPFALDEPMNMGDAGTIYGRDDEHNSIEIGFVLPGSEEKYGWGK